MTSTVIRNEDRLKLILTVAWDYPQDDVLMDIALAER
jgi:hypothetical protein